jgi:DNA-binding SARP family transcriptional activator
MTPAPTLHVTLLGGFLVQVDGRPGNEGVVEELPHGLQRLVAQLSLTGRPARSAIAGQLWPEIPEAHAQRNLRTALWRLQKAVPGLLHVSGGALSLAREVRVDVQELSAWAQRAIRADMQVHGLVLHTGVHGELLPGWYDDWVLNERARLRQLCMHACEAVADQLSRVDRFGEAVQAAYSAIRAAPLRESAHRVLIRVHLAEGNVGEALLAYERFRALLADDLGIQPSRLMEELMENPAQSLVHSPRNDAASVVDGLRSATVGRSRLSDRAW